LRLVAVDHPKHPLVLKISTHRKNRVMRPKIVVPPYEELINLPTDQLLALRVELVDAATSIETQLTESKQDGTYDPIWEQRSHAALSHFRRGLATIKAETARREGRTPHQPVIDPRIDDAFISIDQIRTTLKAFNQLYVAVQAFVEEDTDENFERLEQLVTRNVEN
jgi:hypothetical protein